jgi:hypothetical protein
VTPIKTALNLHDVLSLQAVKVKAAVHSSGRISRVGHVVIVDYRKSKSRLGYPPLTSRSYQAS